MMARVMTQFLRYVPGLVLWSLTLLFFWLSGTTWPSFWVMLWLGLIHGFASVTIMDLLVDLFL